jgi:hypothetical protein
MKNGIHRCVGISFSQGSLLVIWTALLWWPPAAWASVKLLSTVPAMLATGISTNAPVVFTFSEAMDPSVTSATFSDITSPSVSLPVTTDWSVSNSVLTCTPTTPFPMGKMIAWEVKGKSAKGVSLSGSTQGFFTTVKGSGGGSGGSGTVYPTGNTNQNTVFALGKTHLYTQTNSSAPVLSPSIPYSFSASAMLASNVAVSEVGVKTPLSRNLSLSENFVRKGMYYFYINGTNASALDRDYPDGQYAFGVQGTPTLQATVSLPASAALPQPPAPRVSNYDAAQSIDASQPFVLTWDPFNGATAADFISVLADNFETPEPGQPGALTGTIASFTIPANTFRPSSNYFVIVAFYHTVIGTNTAMNCGTVAYRGTATRLGLVTAPSGVVPTPIVFSHPAWTGAGFQFELSGAPGQTIILQTNSSLGPGQWQKWRTVNLPAARVQVTDPLASSVTPRFYRAQVSP